MTMNKDPIANAMQALQAYTLHSMLSHCNANVRTLVTRGELESALKRMSANSSIDDALEFLTAQEVAAGRLPCTAVVIDEQTRRPWNGFFDVLRANGIEIADELEDWKATLAELGVAPYTLAELYQAAPRAPLPERHPLA
jgi:hypothetical protein